MSIITPQEDNFYQVLDLKFHYFAKMANLLNFDLANYTILKNLPMMAYITNIRKSNSLIFNSVNLTIMGKVAKLNSVYIFIL